MGMYISFAYKFYRFKLEIFFVNWQEILHQMYENIYFILIWIL
jgi:hypothetical protein